MMTSRDELVTTLTAPGAAFELRDRVVDGIPWRTYATAPASLREVVLGTEVHGDADFLVYEDTRISFGRHLDLVAALARHLADGCGVRPGDRVAIAMRNYPEWTVSFWATQVIGAVAVPLNAWWTGPELEYALVDAAPVALVADGERIERLRDAVASRSDLEVVAAHHRGGLPAWAKDWNAVVADAAGATIPDVSIGPEDPATILYTSGTTGRPKGAVATQRNHVTNLMNMLFIGALGTALVPVTDPSAGEGGDSARPATLQVFPFFHIGGLSGLVANTAVGAKLVTMYKWDVDEALDLLEREQISATAMVPTLLRQLLDHPSLPRRRLPRLGGLSSGGAPVPPDLIRRVERDFEGRVGAGNGYGLTETTSAVLINSGREYFDHPDSVGRPVPGADIRIVDLDGDDAAPGEIGELWIRGPNVVRGYWNKPEATAESFTDGWFHTGDLGKVDENGLYYVVDRLKDVIIRNGENVYCAEVEAVLFEHPDVADVALVGLLHEQVGEEVAAVVNLRAGAVATAADLQHFVAERLASFKVPSRVFIRDEPLPRTPTGKVLKRELRETLVGNP